MSEVEREQPQEVMLLNQATKERPVNEQDRYL